MSDGNIRLLACATCKTIEPLPDYTGPQAMAKEYDHTLNTLLSKHVFPGADRLPHLGMLFRDIPEHQWNGPSQNDITKQISLRLAGGETGLGGEYYATKDTFKEDAATCWKKHGKRVNCEDFKSEKMLLKPDTAKDRKDLGVGEYKSNIHLCNFCVVGSMVEQRIREKRLKKED